MRGQNLDSLLASQAIRELTQVLADGLAFTNAVNVYLASGMEAEFGACVSIVQRLGAEFVKANMEQESGISVETSETKEPSGDSIVRDDPADAVERDDDESGVQTSSE